MTTRRSANLRGLVVSDLHLFARRSNGLECMNALTPRLAQTDLLILNGDIFDFRWSTHSEHAHSIQEAILWLRHLSNSIPHCRIHYVLGNHDCLLEFIPELAQLKRHQSNFEWHEYSVQFDDHLFLHGDCTQSKMDQTGLKRYREFWSRDGRRHGPATTAYQMADRLGFTRMVHKIHFPRERTLRRLIHHLDDARPEWRRSVRHCYFGHTHEPFSGVVANEITFHNTGCAIRGMAFNPIEFSTNRVSEH